MAYIISRLETEKPKKADFVKNQKIKAKRYSRFLTTLRWSLFLNIVLFILLIWRLFG